MEPASVLSASAHDAAAARATDETESLSSSSLSASSLSSSSILSASSETGDVGGHRGDGDGDGTAPPYDPWSGLVFGGGNSASGAGGGRGAQEGGDDGGAVVDDVVGVQEGGGSDRVAVLAERGRSVFRSFLTSLVQFHAGFVAAARHDRLVQLIRSSGTTKAHLKDAVILHGGITCCSLLLWQHALLPGVRSLSCYDPLAFYFEPAASLSNGSDASTSGPEPQQVVSCGEDWLSSAVVIVATLLFYFLWVFPEYVLAQVENGKWLKDISVRAYARFVFLRRERQARQLRSHEEKTLYRRQARHGSSSRRESRAIRGHRPGDVAKGALQKFAEAVYASTFVIMLLLLQTTIAAVVPGFAGFAVSQLVLSWAYALLCFEYRLPDWELDERFRYVEANWPFFSGFGVAVAIPCALADWWGGFFLSYGVWFLVLPLFVVNAIGASRPPHERRAGRSVFVVRFVFDAAKHLNSVVLRMLVWIIEDGLKLLYRFFLWVRR
jgi:Sulfate transporter CysZ/Etoposide-induced protein 2.4